MFRQMMKRFAEAAKVEVARWRDPGAKPEPAPAAEPAPTVEAAPEPPTAPAPKQGPDWSSAATHVQWLPSTTCPGCGGAKEPGWYRCDACRPRAAS